MIGLVLDFTCSHVGVVDKQVPRRLALARYIIVITTVRSRYFWPASEWNLELVGYSIKIHSSNLGLPI